MSLTIWTNAKFSESDTRLLVEGTRAHQLIFSAQSSASVLAAGSADPDLPRADIALGQPDVTQCLASERLRWVEVTTAGYTRYDTRLFGKLFSDVGRRSPMPPMCLRIRARSMCSP
jgi:hypothetical protein